MPDRPEIPVPDEAIKAAFGVLPAQGLTAALQAAAPAIRSDERRRVRKLVENVENQYHRGGHEAAYLAFEDCADSILAALDKEVDDVD